ncbi:MAG TPA: glycoside hydrolase family 18 protein [Acidobacteriaceae bacterium]|jgi:chitinase|nr:glycoside hydrolase family 18 protein [Acidobacteriaceae bacterium]
MIPDNFVSTWKRAARMFRLCVLLLTGLSCSPALLAGALRSTKQPVIIAYVFPQNKVLQPGEIAAQKLTRINYAFANLQGGKIVDGFPSDAQNFAALLALKKQNPSLTVLVSVGGWLWSGRFSDMALTKQSRSLFIDSVVQFIEGYKLDGLDIDWEYPGMAGATNNFRPQDKQNYTLLLKELRKRFNHEQKALHRRLYLSIATGASEDFLQHTQMAKVQKYVDTVNLMAYDYYEPDSDAITGHNAPLFTNPADPKKVSADQSVQEYEQAGVPASKIVLGVPFYGHTWGQVSEQNHGLFQPGKPTPHSYADYKDVAGNLQDNGFIRYWDSTASVPYLYSPTEKIFISYEDAQSLALKCKYILDHKLAGVMFWDYSGDPSGVLLNTIQASLYKSAGTQGEAQ